MIYPDPQYFDYSASAPPFSEILEIIKEYSFKYYANPSSTHKPGNDAKHTLLELKKQFCDLLNFKEGRLLLCSSGTEANNTIIEGHRKKFPNGKILIAENVHDSIWYANKNHPKNIDILNIDKSGDITIKNLKSKISKHTSLVCMSHACSETGFIYPIEEIAAFCSQKNIKLHIDGVQAVGHIPVDLDSVNCDYYSFSAHKFGGPRSVGGLLIRDDEFEPLLSGGKHEWSLRAGTENLAGLAGCVIALEKSISILKDEIQRLNTLKLKFIGKLKSSYSKVLINGPSEGLPGFISISLPAFLGTEIANDLSLSGFYVSTGSACNANRVEPSRIILALGRSKSEAKGTIRITMGRGTTEEAVNNLYNTLIHIIMK